MTVRAAGWLAAAGLSLIVWAVYGHHRDCRPVCPDFVPDDWPPFRPAGMWETR